MTIPKEKTVFTACPGWGCHEHCVLTTYVDDGLIERTERAVLKGSQAERYGICQKGILAGKLPYLPERILYPMKRVGKRGEGKFERISWEQAMDEIGAKLNELRDKYGPRSVILNTFPCGYPIIFGANGMLLEMRFIHTFDSSRMHLPGIDQGVISTLAIDYGDSTLMMNMNVIGMTESKHIIIWGGNPIGYTRAAATTRSILEAQERGAKIVTIGVLYDTSAAKADQFVPIRPGTDAALALSMANVLLQEELYDEDVLVKHTVAPFLVREDNGKFLRESDIKSGGDPANYVYWNKDLGKHCPIAAHVSEFGDLYPDLTADVTVKGIHCKTAFLKLKEHLAPWTPESQEEVTGVSADGARQLVHEYIANKPATIFQNYGFRYMNGVHTARAINLLTVLSGNVALRGGRPMIGPLGDGHQVALNDTAVMWPDGFENIKGDHVQFTEVLDSFENPKMQQYKAFINTFANPLQCWPNPDTWVNKVLPNLDLFVVFEVRETDTTKYADYILPECTVFEREEIICPSGDCIVLQQPAIEPLGESKPPAFIWRELAKRVGLGRYFEDMDTEDWLRLRLQTNDPAITSLEPPVTLERLREEKAIRLNVPDDIAPGWESLDFRTPTGRIEFYCEGLADVGTAMAIYTEPQILGPKRKVYPLQLFPGRHRAFMQSQFHEYPELRAVAGHVATVALNPIDAKNRGICNDDWVDVYNDMGSVRAKAILCEGYPTGMAHLWYSYPEKDYPGDPPTVLSTTLSGHETEDAFSLKWGEVWRQQNIAAGIPPVLIFQNGSLTTNETLWDDVCDVRKANGGK